jgi:Protein of unknown function (DUF1638)
MVVAARPLVLACAALARDLRAVLDADGLREAVEVEYLPAWLHNRPERIVPELAPRLAAARQAGRKVMVAYADCGTGGRLDALLAEHPGVVRLPGAHCYEMFAGSETFAVLQESEPGTFYLTDFLARHFDALVWTGLGMDRHPELRDAYFGHYHRLLYLSQTSDDRLLAVARAAAERLGLEFEHHRTGRERLAGALSVLVDRVA